MVKVDVYDTEANDLNDICEKYDTTTAEIIQNILFWLTPEEIEEIMS